MFSLFIDTTHFLNIGILNDKKQWMAFESILDTKTSKRSHSLIYDLLLKNNLDIKNLSSIFQIVGPGSYTGIRLSEGLAQVFEILGVEIYSFYHMDIPKILDVSCGVFISNAYKGEYFVHRWDKTLDESFFVPYQNLKLDEIPYTNFSEQKSISTIDLLKENSERIFSYIEKNKIKKEIFYYRPEDIEFTIKPKK